MKNLIPIYILIGVVIGAGALYIAENELGNWGKCPEVFKLPKEEATEKVVNFINESILQGQAEASIANIVEEGSLYKITLDIEGQTFDSYVTLDGKILFPEAVNLEEFQQEPEEQPDKLGEPEKQEETPENSGSLEDFAKCLTDKGMKLYFSGSCPWCQKQKELFTDSFQYLVATDCLESNEECEEKQISGVPTWILPNGEKSPGFKELERLAELSGCSL